MSHVQNVLFIDNVDSHEEAFREAMATANGGPYHCDWAKTLLQGMELAREKPMWAIFVNLSLPDSCGLDTIDALLHAAPGIPILVIGGKEQESIALEALQRGAKDYLLEGHIDTYSLDRAIRNMAERKTAEEELFTEKDRAQVTLNSIGDAVLSTDISGNVFYLNTVAEQMTGWSCAEARGKPLMEVFRIIDGGTRQDSADPLQLAIQTGTTVGLSANCILIRRDGVECFIEDSAAPIHDRSGLTTGAVIVFRDVEMSKTRTEEMAHMAKHDSLTKLPNRTVIMDRIEQAIARARRNSTRLAVLYLDLDGFKDINDSQGHAAGDAVLQATAKRLVDCVRHCDTVARQGGDEFVILLSEISHAEDAGIKAKKILTALNSESKNELDAKVSLSIGVSIYPGDGEDAQTLIKNADTAMYHAKEKGSHTYKCYDKQMKVQAIERQSLESELGTALERHEFVLYYQPKLSLETGKIAGVEALIRWLHPERGLICPTEFIRGAEDCGLIQPIGQWVLREACRQTQAWIDAGLHAIPVAVNVSSLEFRSDGFLKNLRAILKDTRLDPHYLQLELTETVLMQHAKSSASVLGALKSIGVSLAMDDFGTGYSSLSYLKRFPIDSLKLDQSFIHDINRNADDSTLVSAVISMGKNLKKCVVAEGVETREQMTFLQAHGCDQAQGNYFSKPIEALQFAKLLEKGKTPFTAHVSSSVLASA